MTTAQWTDFLGQMKRAELSPGEVARMREALGSCPTHGSTLRGGRYMRPVRRQASVSEVAAR